MSQNFELKFRLRDVGAVTDRSVVLPVGQYLSVGSNSKADVHIKEFEPIQFDLFAIRDQADRLRLFICDSRPAEQRKSSGTYVRDVLAGPNQIELHRRSAIRVDGRSISPIRIEIESFTLIPPNFWGTHGVLSTPSPEETRQVEASRLEPKEEKPAVQLRPWYGGELLPSSPQVITPATDPCSFGGKTRAVAEKLAQERRLVEEQEAPKPNDKPATWELVIADMKERDAGGRAKYGTPLQPGNGRNSLVDLYQELLDAAAYVRNEIEEAKERDAKNAELEEEVARLRAELEEERDRARDW